MKKALGVLLMVTVLLLSACTPGGFKPDHKYKVKDFEYTTHRNETLSLEDLKGEVWLAQFVFTNCTTVCLPMMANMTDLQEKLEDKGLEKYKIVSFSVDPAFDTPEVLANYLDGYSPVVPEKWEMLTGYSQEHISKFAIDSFKQIVVDDPNSDQVIHGTGFILVDKDGVAVKTYSGVTDVPFDEIVEDMMVLSKKE